MIPLSDMKPREVSFVVVIQGGQEVELTMRPFNMADYAWFQDNFGTPERQAEIEAMRVRAIAEFSWRQLDARSQAFFSNIQYERFNEDTGEVENVEARGYEKLLYALYGEENFWKLFDAYLKSKGTNGFAKNDDDIGLKKKVKTATQEKKKSTGLKSSTSLVQNMATRLKKFLR